MGNPYAPPEPGSPLPERPAVPPPPPSPQPPRPPDPETARGVSRLVLRFCLLMLGGLVALQLPVPWQAVGIPVTVLGLVVGVQALRRVSAARLRPGMTVSVAVGLLLGALMLLLHVAMLAVWPAAFELQECRQRALTISAERECRQDYERWLRERSQFSGFDR